MGKDLIQQRRGSGNPVYRSNSFTWAGEIKLPPVTNETITGTVLDIIHSRGHSAPLMVVSFGDVYSLLPAPLGIKVGDSILAGENAEFKPGHILPLSKVPEGSNVYLIEKTFGDGGKFVRAAGTSAKVVTQGENVTVVQMPSGKLVKFDGRNRVVFGIIAGGGVKEKPFVKAGNKYHKKRAKHKKYPDVSGVSMNAVDHPFGGKHSHRKGRPTIAPRNAPPGRKVGMIRPRKTGRGASR
ncbi:MAG: 50S ribosomal protein L2 [Candidatus Woesearchaeota archaeon]